MLGLAPDPDKDDLFEQSRGYPLSYNPDDDPEIQEEAALAKTELALEREGKLQPASEDQSDVDTEDDDDDTTDEENSGVDEGDEAEKDGLNASTASKPRKAAKKKPARTWTAADKVCVPRLYYCAIHVRIDTLLN